MNERSRRCRAGGVICAGLGVVLLIALAAGANRQLAWSRGSQLWIVSTRHARLHLLHVNVADLPVGKVEFDRRANRVRLIFRGNSMLDQTLDAAGPPLASRSVGIHFDSSTLMMPSGPTIRSTLARGPLWPLAVLAFMLVAVPVFRTARRSRHRAGHCPTCGYDLRASPARCPECGTPAAEEGSAKE